MTGQYPRVPNAPNDKNPRPDLGNNGFCLLELEKDKVKLTYYDWLKNTPYEMEFSSCVVLFCEGEYEPG